MRPTSTALAIAFLQPVLAWHGRLKKCDFEARSNRGLACPNDGPYGDGDLVVAVAPHVLGDTYNRQKNCGRHMTLSCYSRMLFTNGTQMTMHLGVAKALAEDVCQTCAEDDSVEATPAVWDMHENGRAKWAGLAELKEVVTWVDYTFDD